MSNIFDTDKGTDYQRLLEMHTAPEPGYIPRETTYASAEALERGLTPIEAGLDSLIPANEFESRLAEAHAKQILPCYHQAKSWRPDGFRWDQSSTNYCWTWSGTGCLMTTRAVEGKPTVMLAPASMGYLVGWANRGNYLESYIKGAREQGVCPAQDGNWNTTNRSKSYWDGFADKRKLYRLKDVWDTDVRNMTQHCVTGLCAGCSGYIAYDWWSHALELVGIRYVNGKMEWDISNSHASDNGKLITLTGSRAVPSECFFFVSTVQTE